jgi:hypothetical protein
MDAPLDCISSQYLFPATTGTEPTYVPVRVAAKAPDKVTEEAIELGVRVPTNDPNDAAPVLL